jgi:hypothetical protein
VTKRKEEREKGRERARERERVRRSSVASIMPRGTSSLSKRRVHDDDGEQQQGSLPPLADGPPALRQQSYVRRMPGAYHCRPGSPPVRAGPPPTAATTSVLTAERPKRSEPEFEPDPALEHSGDEAVAVAPSPSGPKDPEILLEAEPVLSIVVHAVPVLPQHVPTPKSPPPPSSARGPPGASRRSPTARGVAIVLVVVAGATAAFAIHKLLRPRGRHDAAACWAAGAATEEQRRHPFRPWQLRGLLEMVALAPRLWLPRKAP